MNDKHTPSFGSVDQASGCEANVAYVSAIDIAESVDWTASSTLSCLSVPRDNLNTLSIDSSSLATC